MTTNPSPLAGVPAADHQDVGSELLSRLERLRSVAIHAQAWSNGQDYSSESELYLSLERLQPGDLEG